MSKEIMKLLSQGESVVIAFKECCNKIGDSVYQTVLYLRKQSSYSENKIFPYATISDLRMNLINRVKQMAVNQSKDHPWQNMSNYRYFKNTKNKKRNTAAY
ncbi:MAG: hypothetical protein LBI80_01975 [Endomicrobium sp.]|jgi:ATP-dependent DNA helicase RecG|nr:hypothetical protein [Endomicrobium sp.]